MASFEFKIIGANELSFSLLESGKNVKAGIESALQDIADHLYDEVRNKFGEYQAGWPKLKRASVEAKYERRMLSGFRRPKLNDKSKKILFTGDDPLVLHAELHDSIKKQVDSNEAIVYSDNPYSAVHEYGYAPKNIPSRSYMRLTLSQEEGQVIKILNDKIDKAL